METAPRNVESARDSSAPTKLGALLRVVVFGFLAFAGMSLFGPLLAETGYFLGAVLSTFAAAAIANALALRIWERAHLADLGLYWTAASRRNLALGFIGGAGAANLALGVPLLGRVAEMHPTPDAGPTWGAVLFVTLLLLFGALCEEVLFRGYAFQVLISTFGTWATILPMGALFGAAHAINPSATLLGTANTAAWGVLLGYAVVRSGDLWLAIGLHFGWNWTLPWYGVHLSGFNIKMTGYAMQWKIGELWSGGEYGPEGGLLCTLVLGALIVFLWKAPILRQVLPLIEREKEQL